MGTTQLFLPGNATPAQVLSGQTFSAGTNYDANGTMPNEGSVILTPSGTGTVSIPAGYHNGDGYVGQVSVPASDVLIGTNIAGVTGTMPNNGSPTWIPGTSNQDLLVGYYSGGTVTGDSNLVAGNIRNGVSIFGVAGALASGASGIATVAYNKVQGISYITVSGLSFTPSVVSILDPSAVVVFNSAYSSTSAFFSSAIITQWFGFPSYGSFSILGGSFTFEFSYMTPGQAVYWTAN